MSTFRPGLILQPRMTTQRNLQLLCKSHSPLHIRRMLYIHFPYCMYVRNMGALLPNLPHQAIVYIWWMRLWNRAPPWELQGVCDPVVMREKEDQGRPGWITQVTRHTFPSKSDNIYVSVTSETLFLFTTCIYLCTIKTARRPPVAAISFFSPLSLNTSLSSPPSYSSTFIAIQAKLQQHKWK